MKARHAMLVALAALCSSSSLARPQPSAAVRDLFGNGKPHVARGFYPSEGKRGSFTVRLVHMDERRRQRNVGVADRA